MSGDDVVFMDPPPSTTSTWGKAFARLAPLRERPGEWARIRHNVNPTTAASERSNIHRGAFRGIERGEYEVVVRPNGDGTSDVYARYIGNGSAGEPAGAQPS